MASRSAAGIGGGSQSQAAQRPVAPCRNSRTRRSRSSSWDAGADHLGRKGSPKDCPINCEKERTGKGGHDDPDLCFSSRYRFKFSRLERERHVPPRANPSTPLGSTVPRVISGSPGKAEPAPIAPAQESGRGDVTGGADFVTIVIRLGAPKRTVPREHSWSASPILCPCPTCRPALTPQLALAEPSSRPKRNPPT